MNAKEIYSNRLAFAKKLINRNVFSIDVYSRYFEIPKSEAEKDLSNIGITDFASVESKNPIELSLLLGKRTEILKKSDYSPEALGELGFWYNPSNKISEYPTALDAAINYYQTERALKGTYNVKISTIKSTFKLTTAELDDLRHKISEKEILKYDERILKDKAEELKVLLNSSPVTDVGTLTGVEKIKLYDISRELSKSYIKEHSNLLGKHVPQKQFYRKQEIMQKVWDMYNEYGSTHGRTQKEIAEELGLTRETVSHYITTYKKQHPEVVDVTQLYQPHHIGKAKTEAREAIKQKVATAYQAGLNIEQICKAFQLSNKMVTQYLKEDGLIIAHANTPSNKEKFDGSVRAAKVGYDNKGQLASWQTNNDGIRTMFRGATSQLLDEQGAGSYTSDFDNRTRLRGRILNNQRDTMAMLRNSPEALQEFIQTNGQAAQIIAAQELIAQRQKELNSTHDMEQEIADDFEM